MLGSGGKVPEREPKSHILMFFCKKLKNPAVKHFIEQPILLNFLYLLQTFCLKLFEEKYFHSELSRVTLISKLLKISVFKKAQSFSQTDI